MKITSCLYIGSGDDVVEIEIAMFLSYFLVWSHPFQFKPDPDHLLSFTRKIGMILWL